MQGVKSSDMVGIRPATSADAEAIREVARASWHAACDELLGEKTVEEQSKTGTQSMDFGRHSDTEHTSTVWPETM
jgi:hypothetical protein